MIRLLLISFGLFTLATCPVQAADPQPVPPAPDSLGAQLMLGAAGLMDDAGAWVQDALRFLRDLPGLGSWAMTVLTEPLMRDWFLDALWRLALVLGVGLTVQWLAGRALRRPRAALAVRAPRTPEAETPESEEGGQARAERGETEALFGTPRAGTVLRRMPCAIGRLVLDLLPVLAFLLGAHLVVATPVSGTPLTRLVILAVVQAYVVWCFVRCLADALVAPDMPRLRLLPIGDAGAAYIMRWTSRIAGLVVFGDAAAQAALLLGLSRAAHAGWLKVLVFVAHLCLIVIVVRRRRAVADWIRSGPEASGPLARLRDRLAPLWHWVAILFLVGLWIVWATEVRQGYARLLYFFVTTAAVLLLARLATIGLRSALERLLSIAPDVEARYPGLDARARGYHPLLRLVAGLAMTGITAIALLEVWGFGPLRWLAGTQPGRAVLSGLGAIGITMLLALMVWEAANLGISRHLARLDEAAQGARSARLRTLLPMLRTTLFITILIVVGLTVLSQIGLNIAPLLAGAGVLGIAIGFGSQKLVQDVITGLFLLLENAMQVGDVVTLGGLTGVVEELSIRSIRLRAEDGSVHVIPFSAVTTVTNMTRDFSQAVIEARVAYTEDYDTVVQLLRDIVTRMRAEPLWQDEILAELEVMGLARFVDAAIVIKCRIKCGPFARWRVQREFHRRMKQSFEEHGIEIPPPSVAGEGR